MTTLPPIELKGHLRMPVWLERISKTYWFFHHAWHYGNVALWHSYGADAKALQYFIAFCTIHDLQFSIHGRSEYHPHALKIIAWRLQDEDEVRRYWKHLKRSHEHAANRAAVAKGMESREKL